jgi:hypothetical protein
MHSKQTIIASHHAALSSRSSNFHSNTNSLALGQSYDSRRCLKGTQGKIVIWITHFISVVCAFCCYCAFNRLLGQISCLMNANFYPLLDAGKRQLVTISGNPGSNGPFAPLVRVVRDAMGVKEFNQFRGKMISLHSQGMLVMWYSE